MSGGERGRGGDGGEGFDPIAEGARYKLSSEAASMICERVRGEATDLRGRCDLARARAHFHELAARGAERSKLRSPGQGTHIEGPASGRPWHGESASLPEGKQTLVEAEGRRLGSSPGAGAPTQSGPNDGAFDSWLGNMIASAGRPVANAPTSGAAGGGGNPVGSSPAASPPDLGNYDSEVGKYVVALRSWDDTTIAARRVEMQGLLARTLEIKKRDKLLREYEAIEWVARERKLTLPKDPGEQASPQGYVGGKPTKFWAPDTAQGGRAMLEREMAEGTSYGAAKDHAAMRIGYATMQRSPTDNDKRLIGDQQGQLMDHDAAAFRAAFQVEAKQTALSLLDASSVAVDGVLRSYGIAGGTFRLSDAARKVAANPGSLDAEVETWLALSQRLDGNQAAFAAGHVNREGSPRKLSTSVTCRTTSPCWRANNCGSSSSSKSGALSTRA